jgi:DAACS family dicarboxylate/amino acid:cation (Na+ or H+) symporter
VSAGSEVQDGPRIPLHTKILAGLIIGAIAGVTVNLTVGPDAGSVRWVNQYVAGPVGQVFLRMLFMIVMPLVFASISLGVAGLGDVRKIGTVGGKTMLYFFVSTALAAVLGLVLVQVLQPGLGLSPEVTADLMAAYATDATAKVEQQAAGGFGVQTFVNIVTRNPVQSAASGDMLGVIFFSLLFGAALTLIDKATAKPMIDVLTALNEVVIKIVNMAMRIAPLGVAGLIFGVTSMFGFALLKPIGLYVITVLLGLALHMFVTMGVLLRVLAGVGIFDFLKRIRAVIVTAVSTSSSAATLPTSIAVAQSNLGAPPQIAGFVLPMGTTMCMNGTSLFEGITVIFLCQVFGVDLTLAQMVIVMTMAVITAIGAAGVPGGSIPLLVGILALFGVPGEGIAIILGVDRILDAARTVVNVVGDHAGTLIIGKSEGVWDASKLPQST